MRVIAGELKGRKISPVKGEQIRYTSDRVKESLFGILGESVVSKNFSDLCSGSGNVGIEALSRGARQVTFVDISSLCTKTIWDNLKELGLEPHSTNLKVLRADTRVALRKFAKENLKFDQIFIDPPYESALLDCSLKEIASLNILSPSGCIIAEHRKSEVLRERYSSINSFNSFNSFNSLCMTRQKKYGDTILSFYEWELKK